MPEMLSRALVLTGTPGSGTVETAAINTAREAIASATRAFDIHSFDEQSLAPGEAWRALFAAPEHAPLPDLRQTFRQALAAFPIDVNVVPDDIAYTRKRLLVADMESTIIEQEMLDEMAGEIGLRGRVSGITERAMRGELDFEEALSERVALFAGLDAEILERFAREHITFMPGARTLVATMRANGATCALVSGGFTCFTATVAEKLRFHIHQANTLEVEGGRIAGRVTPPILGRNAKREALRRIARDNGIDETLTLAVGDGANDLAMLSEAGLGVAFRAKPKVREAATTIPGGAVITHGDLTALLYLQGFTRDEFVTT